MPKKAEKSASSPEVFTLLVELGRSPDDDLPEGASGAALLIYASGANEAEAVRETVAVLKTAGVRPLDVTSYGTLAERLKAGDHIPEEERELMARAAEENAVIVAQKTYFTDEAEDD
ncbi:MAG: hypothetical protein EA407_01485 [Rhodobacteraceae bacterium]|nr:MAG: hypothetical protein EA407_01485 [Paracoccaceae bacterium]